MYCFKCGAKIEPDGKFCSFCGASQAPEVTHVQPEQTLQTNIIEPQPPYIQPVYETPGYEMHAHEAPSHQTFKPRKWIWITAASAAAVIIALCAVYFIFFQNVSHMLTVGKALGNLNKEAEMRIDNSPVKALKMLPEIMEDGTISASIDYSHDFADYWFGAELGADIILSSNTKTREFALNIKETFSSGFSDIDIYMNRERLALRLGLLDDNFYGIRYDTFRDDVRVFGSLLFLDDEIMDVMSDIVDMINEIINYEETDDLQEAYRDVLIKFMGNLKTSKNRSTFEFEGEQIRCSAIELTITKEDIVTLMNGIYEIYETNESFRAQFNMYDNPSFQGFLGEFGADIYEDYLTNSRELIDDIDKFYEGDIKITFFIGNRDRLLGISANAETKYDNEEYIFDALFSFGKSAEDDWTFVFSSNNEPESVTITWSYIDQSGNHVNTIEIRTNSSTIEFVSEWDINSRQFKLSHKDGWWPESTITGLFVSDDKQFQLKLDNLLSGQSGANLIIDLTAVPGAQIDNIEYINIDKWGQTLINALLRLAMGLIF